MFKPTMKQILSVVMFLCCLSCVSLCNEHSVKKEKSSYEVKRDEYLFAAETWFVPGTSAKAIPTFLGKPDFTDSKGRLWYKASEKIKKELKVNSGDVYVRITLKNDVVVLVEKIILNLLSKTKKELLLDDLHGRNAPKKDE